MVEEKETKVEKKEAKIAKLVEVPATYGQVIELEDGTQVSDLELQILIYNKLLKIERSVA